MRLDNNCAFDAVHIFECGQCFRWNSDENGEYTGVAGGKVCRISKREIICDSADEDFWKKYFDLDNDYKKIGDTLIKTDEKLESCIKFGNGIRILRQDVWETIISFIISANNNIPRIKGIIEKMCVLWGEKITFEGKEHYSFPKPSVIAQLKCEDLAPLRAGYRDKYIIDAAKRISSGEIDLDELPNMDDALLKKTLMQIKGVGGKVADCIMLFSLGRYSVFPTDVWIKRILKEVYEVEEKEIPQFVTEKYGDLAGFAQQYLYYYYRDNNI